MNRARIVATAVLLAAVAVVPVRAATAVPTTVSGIPLDAPWKVKTYAFARAHFHHPAWGWQHSERDYRLALKFATADGLPVDRDVLFAAAMMHDMAAFAPWAKANGEHGDLAAKACVPILRDGGLPDGSYRRGASRGTRPHVLPDAAWGGSDRAPRRRLRRLLGRDGREPHHRDRRRERIDHARCGGVAPQLELHDIPPKLITKAAKRAAVPRIAQLRAFLDALDAQAYGGTLL